MIKIDLESVDGAGKTTALKYLVEEAKKLGLNVIETREVGNPHIPICVKLREVVLDPNSNLSGESMEFIFSAMRMENDIWLNKLQYSENPPDLVISDRGLFSHLAYTDHNVSEQFTRDLYSKLVCQLTSYPDVVIYFSVNTETALKRRVKRGTGMDVIEIKGVEFQEKVRKSFEDYLSYAENNADNNRNLMLFNIDANQDIEGVQKQLDAVLNTIASKIKRP